MTTFYICRHGQTENNKAKRLQGWIDTPLTAEGIENARSSATKLAGIKFDAIVSSDLGRAFTSAYIISRELGYQGEIHRYKDLREVNYGELANAHHKNYPKHPISEHADYTPSGGESLRQMQARILDCLREISDAYPDKTVLIVGHDGTINSIEAHYNDTDIGLADNKSHAHDSVAKFVYSDGRVMSFEKLNLGL